MIGVPITCDGRESPTKVLGFEAALMALDGTKKITNPCVRKTLYFGPKKNMGAVKNS
jgi:hypothetical protein